GGGPPGARGRSAVPGPAHAPRSRRALLPWPAPHRDGTRMRERAPVAGDGGCRWGGTVDAPPQYADSHAWQSPTVSRPHDPKAWFAAASRVRRRDGFGFGGLGRIGTGGHVPPVRFNPPVGIGPWKPGHLEEAPFGALEGRVAGCAHPD